MPTDNWRAPSAHAIRQSLDSRLAPCPRAWGEAMTGRCGMMAGRGSPEAAAVEGCVYVGAFPGLGVYVLDGLINLDERLPILATPLRFSRFPLVSQPALDARVESGLSIQVQTCRSGLRTGGRLWAHPGALFVAILSIPRRARVRVLSFKHLNSSSCSIVAHRSLLLPAGSIPSADCGLSSHHGRPRLDWRAVAGTIEP